MSDLIELNRGQPPFDIPACLRDGQARLPAVSRYSRGVGVEAYRRAAAAKMARVNRVDVPWQRVFYTQGSTQGLHAVLSVACRRGDVVAVPRPGYPIYSATARMLGLRVVYYPALLDGPEGAMDAWLTEHRPRVVILNYPSNPLGIMPDAERLAELYAVLARHETLVVADECYDEFSGRPDRSGLVEPLGDRLVLLFSMSKSHAIPSWRMGYLVAPVALADLLSEHQELSLGCGNAELQEVAAEGLLRHIP